MRVLTLVARGRLPRGGRRGPMNASASIARVRAARVAAAARVPRRRAAHRRLPRALRARHLAGCSQERRTRPTSSTQPASTPGSSRRATLLGLAMFATLFLGTILAVFLTLGAVRGDAERGLLQPLLVRPVPRRDAAARPLRRRRGRVRGLRDRRLPVAAVITWAFGGWWPDRMVAPALELAARGRDHRARSRSPARSFLSATANGIAVFMVFGAGPGRRAARPDRRGARLRHARRTSPRSRAGCCRSRRSTRPRSARSDHRHRRLHAPGDRPRPVRRRLGLRPLLWPWALVYLGLVGALALRGFARRDL